MSTDLATQRAEALLQLEHTRVQWVLRAARRGAGAGQSPEGPEADLATGGPLNSLLSEWLTQEIEARLWPAATDPDHPGPDSPRDGSQAPDQPLPSQLISEALTEWTRSHPWLGVLAGVLAGSLAVSQRRRWVQWGISSALPWLASHASVLAVPLLAQWLMRQPEPRTEQAVAPEEGAAATTEANPGVTDDLSATRSSAAGSPG